MPFYVEIKTKTCGTVTANCGSPQIADRLSNQDESTGGGADRALVNQFRFELMQAHDELGGLNTSLAPFTHSLTLFLPDYEPLISVAANVMNQHDAITQLTLNATRRINSGQESVTQTYTMKNGLLVQFRHQVPDQRDSGNLKHRGELMLGFKFQQIQVDDKVSQTSGVIQTNSAQEAV